MGRIVNNYQYKGIMDLTQSKYRFSGHETFPVKYGWIEKLTNFLNLKSDTETLKIDHLKPEDRAVDFGMGLNMARSLKYWAFTTNIIKEINDKEITFSKTGDIIFGKNGKDKYLENINTIWFLHWKLSSNINNFSTWTWFYNYFLDSVFNREKLLTELTTFVNNKHHRISEVSLKRDIDCFIRSYITSKDDELGCPLSELNLLRIESSNTFTCNREPRTITTELITLSIIFYIHSYNITTSTLTIERLLYDPFSPGCIFRLDNDELLIHLEKLEKITSKKLLLDTSSGLSQIIISKEVLNNKNIESYEQKYLRKIYE